MGRPSACTRPPRLFNADPCVNAPCAALTDDAPWAALGAESCVKTHFYVLAALTQERRRRGAARRSALQYKESISIIVRHSIRVSRILVCCLFTELFVVRHCLQFVGAAKKGA